MNKPKFSKDSLSSNQLAEILVVSKKTIYRYATKGIFDAKKLHGKWYFDKDLVKNHLHNPTSEIVVKCKIPLSISQFRFQYGYEPSCLFESPFLKLSKSEFSEKDVNQIASSFVRYLYDRNLSYHTKSWQDYFLHQKTMHAAYVKLLNRRVSELGEPPILAQLKVFFRNFPNIELKEEQLFELDLWKNDALRKKEDVTMESIAKKVIEVTSSKFDVATLKARGVSQEAEKIRHSILRMDKGQLVRIAEAVVGTLIGAGILKLLAWALQHVPIGFAPYAEAQVYEIENVLGQKVDELSPKIEKILEAENIPDVERIILQTYWIHAYVLMAFYGREIGSNPLMKKNKQNSSFFEMITDGWRGFGR